MEKISIFAAILCSYVIRVNNATQSVSRLCGIFFSPRMHRRKNRFEFFADGCERIFNFWRDLREDFSLYNSILFKISELLDQRSMGDAR